MFVVREKMDDTVLPTSGMWYDSPEAARDAAIFKVESFRHAADRVTASMSKETWKKKAEAGYLFMDPE